MASPRGDHQPSWANCSYHGAYSIRLHAELPGPVVRVLNAIAANPSALESQELATVAKVSYSGCARCSTVTGQGTIHHAKIQRARLDRPRLLGDERLSVKDVATH